MNENIDWHYIHDAERRNEFFGEVKFAALPGGNIRVEAVVMPGEDVGNEFFLNALAIDGSSSMVPEFGRNVPPILQEKNNKVQPFAQALAGHLARNESGKCAFAYWACGDDGSDLEPVGLFSAQDFSGMKLKGPAKFGGGTKLAPIIRYFWEQVFVGATKPSVAAVLTDGMWSDQQEVIELTQHMCDEISSGERQLMKVVVLVYVTPTNSKELPAIEASMSELNNYDSGTDVDIWDHKWVDHLGNWSQIYIELVKDKSLGTGGRVLDSAGNVVLARDEFNFGIEFDLPAGSTSFTLVLDGAGEFAQQLS